MIFIGCSRVGMGQFIKTRDYTYCELTLEFLRNFHVIVISGPTC